MTLPAHISTFTDLVRWLVDTRHEGHPYRMARALKVSPDLTARWYEGVVRSPTFATVSKVCRHYGLSATQIAALLLTEPAGARVSRRPKFSRGAGRLMPHLMGDGRAAIPLIGSSGASGDDTEPDTWTPGPRPLGVRLRAALSLLWSTGGHALCRPGWQDACLGA